MIVALASSAISDVSAFNSRSISFAHQFDECKILASVMELTVFTLIHGEVTLPRTRLPEIKHLARQTCRLPQCFRLRRGGRLSLSRGRVPSWIPCSTLPVSSLVTLGTSSGCTRNPSPAFHELSASVRRHNGQQCMGSNSRRSIHITCFHLVISANSD